MLGSTNRLRQAAACDDMIDGQHEGQGPNDLQDHEHLTQKHSKSLHSELGF